MFSAFCFIQRFFNCYLSTQIYSPNCFAKIEDKSLYSGLKYRYLKGDINTEDCLENSTHIV